MEQHNAPKPQAEHRASVLGSTDWGVCLLLGLMALVWAVYGIAHDDMAFPARRGMLHLHGPSAWIAFAAIASLACSMLVRAYDLRRGGQGTPKFVLITAALGVVLLIHLFLFGVHLLS